MTSIKNIHIKDIKLFLRGNDVLIPETDELAYKEAMLLMKNPNLLFYPPAILEWIIAHNLLLSKVKIPNYKEEEILSLNQDKINSLAKLLTMKTNNKYNIINILYYMGKLY